MNFEDFIIFPKPVQFEKYQFGALISENIPENGIAFLWVSDFRGTGNSAEIQDFTPIRKELYQLSKLDFEVPVCDFGDLISGKTPEDSHYILQEIVTFCLNKNTIPVIIGGSNEFAFPLFSAVNFHQKNANYTQISNVVSLSNEGETLNEKNYLTKLLSTKDFSIKNFHLLGYQKHLNEVDSVNLIEEVDFDVVRLSEMMNSTEKTEPYFRKAHLATVNCDAVESFSDAFSMNPQVNGLNRREICAYMKEIGLSENLKAAGIFNYNFETDNLLNHQLLAQMIWYLVEGINIRKSHPKEKKYETFWVMIGDREYAFQREVFSNLWYFGDDENIENCIPCSREDFDLAKKGILNRRFLK